MSDHFYTLSAAERDNACKQYGYHWEGVAGNAFDDPSGLPNLVSLFRLMNPQAGQHFYTISVAERDSAVARSGYRYEGIAAYVQPNDGPGFFPLFRLFLPKTGEHFYTIGKSERDYAIANLGFQDEGISCFLIDANTPGSQPFYRLFNAPRPVTDATDFELSWITYDLAHGHVQSSSPIEKDTETVPNDTDTAQSPTLTGDLEVTDSSSWSLETTAQLTVSGSVQIPIMQDKGSVTLGLSAENSYTVKTEGTASTQRTLSWSAPVEVPPHTTYRCAISVIESQISVPYTMGGQFVFSDGTRFGAWVAGTYSGLYAHDITVSFTTVSNSSEGLVEPIMKVMPTRIPSTSIKLG